VRLKTWWVSRLIQTLKRCDSREMGMNRWLERCKRYARETQKREKGCDVKGKQSQATLSTPYKLLCLKVAQ
jgi:hypothetical protein